jgi:hypothetical protein
LQLHGRGSGGQEFWLDAHVQSIKCDRGMDETDHQIAVYGRIDSRPYTLYEMKRLYLGADSKAFTDTDRVKLEDFVARQQVTD